MSAYLLIDPPVGVWSTPAEVEAWIAELGRWVEEYVNDRVALGQIADARLDAERLLVEVQGLAGS